MELGHAVALGVIFAAILVAARVAQAQLGRAGLWSAGLLGGFVDVDAVAVAAARLRQQGHASLEAAGGSYLLATLANLLVKSGISFFVGGSRLGRLLLPWFAAPAAVSLALLLV